MLLPQSCGLSQVARLRHMDFKNGLARLRSGETWPSCFGCGPGVRSILSHGVGVIEGDGLDGLFSQSHVVCWDLELHTLALIAPYFYVFAPTGRRASLEYLRTLYPQASPLRLRMEVIRHFYTFGLVLLDRLFCQVCGRDDFTIQPTGQDRLAGVIQNGTGAVIVTAHCGGWDLASSVLAANHLGVQSTVAEFVIPTEQVTASKGIARLSVHNASLPILAFKGRLERGELVGMMADRPYTQKLILVPFLGRLAAFDLTPFRLALAVGVPLYHGLAWRKGYQSYGLGLTPSPELGGARRALSAAEREALCERAVRCFADSLAADLRLHPQQWFNFFPFFSRKPSASAAMVQAVAQAPTLA